ncbi:hypothetical protein D6833_04700 [Candidatus Parcubacteria bacterium]|nr:MAG: hypothetical protein D6833_04700 [Candidatus Parcubacteria bacterium]
MNMQSHLGHTKISFCWGGVLLLSLLIVPGLAWSHGAGGNNAQGDENTEKVEMAATAKITIDEAIKAAIDKVAGTVIEAELEKNPGLRGRSKWSRTKERSGKYLSMSIRGPSWRAKRRNQKKKRARKKGE